MKKRSGKYVYLDYASTTPLDNEVAKEVARCNQLIFGNPSSAHKYGQDARQAVDMARFKISRILNCDFREIIFTSSATESNNTILKGVAFYYLHNTNLIPHIITTEIDHKSVLEPLNYLKKFKIEISYLEVGSDGLININRLKSLIKDNTVLISIHYVNSEIGVIQPIKKIAQTLKAINEKRLSKGKAPIVFHTDAVQAANYLTLDTKELMIDAMTLSSHKIYGPKGIALLYLKKATPFEAMMMGGSQEFGFRAGTENVSGICGFSKALEICQNLKEKEGKRLSDLRNYLLKLLRAKLPQVQVNGSLTERIANNLNISLPGIKMDRVIIALDVAGFAVSVGSACLADSSSYVLKAIGTNKNQTRDGIRITLGRFTSRQDIEKFVKVLYTIVLSLRMTNTYE